MIYTQKVWNFTFFVFKILEVYGWNPVLSEVQNFVLISLGAQESMSTYLTFSLTFTDIYTSTISNLSFRLLEKLTVSFSSFGILFHIVGCDARRVVIKCLRIFVVIVLILSNLTIWPYMWRLIFALLNSYRYRLASVWCRKYDLSSLNLFWKP